MNTDSHTPAFVSHAPQDLGGWMRLFEVSALPVLGATADAIEELRLAEDLVDAHTLAEAVKADPLMTLKIMAYLGALRRDRERGEPETLTAALVMLGVPPFFRAFGPQPTVEDELKDQPEALASFRAVLKRSRRAAEMAAAFAIHRQDQDFAVIHEAALLHDFGSLLLWVRAPALALEVARLQAEDPQLRSAHAQRRVLHIELGELRQGLMAAWRLPLLLQAISDPKGRGDQAQSRTVQLAIRVARHSARGWDNPALPDDVTEVADLLQLGIDPTWKLLRAFDD